MGMEGSVSELLPMREMKLTSCTSQGTFASSAMARAMSSSSLCL